MATPLNWDEMMNVPPRSSRGDKPIEYDRTPIRVRGEALNQVWWRGRQWAVTDYGIECLDGTYVIEWKRLLEQLDTFGWPEHMGQKDWVDIDDFTTAWLVGIALHSKYSRALRESISRSVVPDGD